MRFRKLFVCLIALSSLLTFIYYYKPADSLAASDGQVGTTSTGTVNISLSVPKLIRIKNLADVAFPTYTGTGDLNFDKDVTVAVNYTSGGYRITATGSGAANSFTVTNGTFNVPYLVYFNKQAGTAGNASLASGTPLTGLTGAVKPLGSNTLNANYQVKFQESALANVEAGNYTGILTLLVSPE